MNYTPEQFNGCRFNPFEEKLFRSHPALKEILNIEEEPDDDVVDEDKPAKKIILPKESICRYIIALYDPKSPLPRAESNLMKRKMIAIEIAGIQDKDIIDIVIECKKSCIALYIQNYLRMFAKSMEWAMIVSFEGTFWEYQIRLMQPIERGRQDKDLMAAVSLKTQITKDIQELHDKYQLAVSKFYGEDKSLMDKLGTIKRFTPEGIGKLG